MRVRAGPVCVYEAWTLGLIYTDREWKPVPESSDCSTCSHRPYGIPKGPYGVSTALPTLVQPIQYPHVNPNTGPVV